ncbi:MAG: L,D-transpeptidase family protein [Planctomycetota bacterium]|nr:L,D-transpeptidase family protein [Planctomycetota bacterium]
MAADNPLVVVEKIGRRDETATILPGETGMLPSRGADSIRQAGGTVPEPVPVRSRYMEEMREIDQLLRSNPGEARRRLENMVTGVLSGEEEAGINYRLGYAARMLGEEEKAGKYWRGTVEKWPAFPGGRLSALAIADAWYGRYAGTRAEMSRWDEIQALYSLVIGRDDAPFLPEEMKTGIKTRLNILNDAIFFGPAPTRLARYHKVESGEMLGSIASRYRTDYESIARINDIHPNRIHAGMDLKVMTGEVAIVVRKNEKTGKTPVLAWFLDDRWVREYPACVGEGAKTPAGTYTLTLKERDPSWTNPLNGQLLPNNHPENILGSRWMAMKGMNVTGLGIHGTTVDDSIPGYTSAGCIRLYNRDVEELFSYARVGAKVTVTE